MSILFPFFTQQHGTCIAVSLQFGKYIQLHYTTPFEVIYSQLHVRKHFTFLILAHPRLAQYILEG